MTTSSGWDPDPTTPPVATPQFESTPIADDISVTGAGTDLGTERSDTPPAKERAQEAASTAKEQGAHVASTAADEVQQVAGEAKAKAADLLSDVKAQVDEQSRTQLQGLASKVGSLGDELEALLRGDGATDGAVTDLARQLSERTRALSSHLADREPKDLVADVRTFARRRPGTFLIGAAAVGIVAGRLTRGAKQAGDESKSSPTAAAPAPFVAPPSPPSPTAGTFAADVTPSATGTPTGQDTWSRP